MPGPAGATVGTFVVGDGTLVGQIPAPSILKPKLILKGKTFGVFTFTDYHQMLTGKPSLLLRSKQATALHTTVFTPGKPDLLLNAKPVNAILPSIMHMGKGVLVLKGKPVNAPTSSTMTLGKGVLILNGKPLGGGQIVLLPNAPVVINLVPTVPQDLVLVGSVSQTYDLVPTIEEFR
jgi:hypothetical protein